jgi:SAM-dependent methyltransferase
MREPRTHRATLDTTYFDELYARSADPWEFATRWYEQRKYDLTLAALPRPRYANAFEAGCSIGVFTSMLACRCERLIAADASAEAVRRATERTAQFPHVSVECRRLPEQWPEGSFDLVVLSEIGYYFAAGDLAALIAAASAALEPGGTLVAVHWRHPVADYPLTGDAVHEMLAAAGGIERIAAHTEADFRLDVFQRVPPPARSVAQAAGLVG